MHQSLLYDLQFNIEPHTNVKNPKCFQVKNEGLSPLFKDMKSVYARRPCVVT